MLLDYLLVSLFGLLIASAELLARYRENSFTNIIVKNPGAWVYMAINLLASASALFLLRVFGVTFGIESDPDVIRWVQVLAAGFGAMAIFRSSLFSYQIQDQVVSIGPNMVLQIFLDRAGKSVGSQLARANLTKRAVIVANQMRGISFKTASQIIPTVGIALKRNLDPEDQETLGNSIKVLANSNLPESIKVTILGLSMLDMLGEDALHLSISLSRDAVETDSLLKEAEDTFSDEDISALLRQAVDDRTGKVQVDRLDAAEIADLAKKEIDDMDESTTA